MNGVIWSYFEDWPKLSNAVRRIPYGTAGQKNSCPRYRKNPNCLVLKQNPSRKGGLRSERDLVPAGWVRSGKRWRFCWNWCIFGPMKTEIVRLSSDKPEIELLKAAAEVLDGGGLVAFPTETVYGLGCAAEAKAIARLDEVKQRVERKRYTLHIAGKDEVGQYVPRISLRGRKLIKKGWPGPLTIVFELSEAEIEKQRSIIDEDSFNILYRDNTVGIRCPDNAIAKELLRLALKPIVAPSANLGAKQPAITGEEVLAQFDGKIDMVIDGGGCKYKKSSTVVKISGPGLAILREGVVSEAEIEDMSAIKILFICTGNTCRSPMGEAFCRKYLSEKLDCDVDEVEKNGYKVNSAGVMGMLGMCASREAVDICAQKGIDVRSHSSKGFSCEDVNQSDYIFVMSRSHRDRVLEVCPAAGEKCMLLDSTGDIADPIGAGMEVYASCAERIEKALEKRMSEILK